MMKYTCLANQSWLYNTLALVFIFVSNSKSFMYLKVVKQNILVLQLKQIKECDKDNGTYKSKFLAIALRESTLEG